MVVSKVLHEMEGVLVRHGSVLKVEGQSVCLELLQPQSQVRGQVILLPLDLVNSLLVVVIALDVSRRELAYLGC